MIPSIADGLSEAPAVTAIMMEANSIMIEAEPPAELVLDRPFSFAVLFAGQFAGVPGRQITAGSLQTYKEENL